ncbi:MAG: acyltransferase [Pseudomonadota bacterium]
MDDKSNIASRPADIGGSHHIPVLDGVRAASILLVLAGHMLPLGPSQWGLNHSAATGGMSLFFILSGFLICSFLLREPPIGEFLIKRITRIVPAVSLYILIVYGLIDFQPQIGTATGFYIINYYTDYITSLNSHLWSLCVEMHYYIFAALLAWMFGRRGLVLFCVALIAVTFLRVSTGTGISIQTHLRVDEILAGSTLALFYHGYFGDFERAKRLLGLLFPVFALFWMATLRPEFELLFYLRPYSAMLLVGSILYADFKPLRAALTSSPMRYVATISYSLYIWHFFTINFGMNEGDRLTVYLFKRPVSFIALALIAHLSTFYLERPVSKYVRNRFLKKPTRTVVTS